MKKDMSHFWECNCELGFTIEPNGSDYILFFGRCSHRHGDNLAYLTEPAHNFDSKYIEKLLNAGYNKNQKDFK